jgi:iron complex outermembrane receptor protein
MKSHILCGSSAVALMVLAPAAMAQTSPAPAVGQPADPSLKAASAPTSASADQAGGDQATTDQQDPNDSKAGDIVVTGSRVSRAGYDAPTPLTALSNEQLTSAAPSSPSDALRQLPILSNSTGARGSTGSQGSTGTYMNLRNLGPNNTLVLFNGNRFVPTTANGTVNTALFPENLVSRVEVVTGGASAAYGSDAVAGVVNFIIDTEFEGIKGGLQGGTSYKGDSREVKADISFGTGFAGGRGHLLLSAEYFKNNGIYDILSRPLANQSCNAITNAAGTPTKRVFACNVTNSQANYAGIISGPAAFKGITFDRTGQPIPFNYGTNVSATTMVGGGGVRPFNGIDYPGQVPLEREVFFGRLSYKVADGITAYAEGTYGNNYSDYQIGSINTNTGNFAFTIRRDNAYLPASLRTAMTNAAVQTLTMQRFDTDAPRTQMQNSNRTIRALFGVDGEFGGWKWQAHFQHGENRNYLVARWDQDYGNYALAADAVVNPTTGAIVCRSTLTTPGNGCVPINVFGEQPPLTAAQLDYVTDDDWVLVKTKEDNFAADISGNPFSLWAGPVSVATGVEWRREAMKGTALPAGARLNPITGNVGPYRLGNYLPQQGSFDVLEGYLETVIPLAKDTSWAKNLDFNGAVRVTNYTTSGTVVTWKAGLSYQVTDGLRFRATRSRDIRAGTLQELFAARQAGHGTVIDFVQGPNVVANNVPQFTSGNPNLIPQTGDTTTGGVIYRPSWLPGFETSIDGYKIVIKDAILGQSSNAITQACSLGNVDSCTRIERGPDGSIIAIYNTPQNLQSLKTSGIDFEASYRSSFAGGKLTLRGLANYVGQYETNTLLTPVVNLAGQVSNPHWRGVLQLFYDRGPLSFFLQSRYTGRGFYDKSTAADDLPQLMIHGQWLFDTTVSYDLGNKPNSVKLFFNVSNIFNRQPPPFSSTNVYNVVNYDFIGRAFKGGVRFRF